MVYVKIERSSTYFSRYQVKYKRRRQGKTDYRARLRLTSQDKNKYNTPKYRFVVRFSNKDVTCQIAYATVAGDVVVAAAYSHELPRYGLKAGLTNYAATYATGLLLARRVLQKFDLDKTYTGTEEATGDDYNVEAADEGPRPFTALLDTGLKRTSTGSKVFAALKGGLDGGLDIPHGDKRFVGYDTEAKKLDSEQLKKYILGGHVAEYMEEMAEDSEENYNKHFSQFIAADLAGEDLEDKLKEVHAAIRENPAPEKKERSKPSETKNWKAKKLTYDERKQKLKERLSAIKEGGGDDDDE
ncbi:60S ribosomal protein L5 [Trebouxia sp. C0010 RCD-2024]